MVPFGPAMDLGQFESMKQYVGFDDAAAARLREFHPIAEPAFPEVVDDFYEAITQHPDASAAITGGEAQVQRLKSTLIEWLHSLMLGPHDQAYLQAHSRIGRVHVRINLPQQFMFTAMNRIRLGLTNVARAQLPEEGQLRVETIQALERILDLELAIMLDTYRQDWMERVRVNERLATIGQLAASIGHELRNPLGIVQSSLFLMNQRMKKLEIDDSVLRKHHHRIDAQVDACSRTISSLLEMTRDAPPRKTRLRLFDVVESSLAALQIPPGIQHRVDVPVDVEVVADGTQLTQVLTNLVNNSIQALGETGQLQVQGRALESGVEILVSDDGPGIRDEVRDKVFDVLFTTRAHGTGLGLALCRKIVQAHGGELQLVSTESGACFRIWLP